MARSPIPVCGPLTRSCTSGPLTLSSSSLPPHTTVSTQSVFSDYLVRGASTPTTRHARHTTDWQKRLIQLAPLSAPPERNGTCHVFLERCYPPLGGCPHCYHVMYSVRKRPCVEEGWRDACQNKAFHITVNDKEIREFLLSYKGEMKQEALPFPYLRHTAPGDRDTFQRERKTA